MKTCEFSEYGQLCGQRQSGFCVNCGKPVCERHTIATSEGLMCVECAANTRKEIDSATPIIEYPENEDVFWDQIS